MQTDSIEYPHQVGEDILNPESFLVRANTAKRLANYIVDIIAYYLLAILVGIGLALAFPSAFQSLADDNSSIGFIDRIISMILYAIFMSLVEGFFKGKSLGKLLTRTRAVNLDGTRISFRTAFARGFSRAVPFCVFSAFGTPCDPWQDRWTGTMVIDEAQSTVVL
jgi:uncharacterized RDD family membrane protein YckC